jgi:hypothetical protein
MPPTIISSLFNGLKRARIRSRNVTSTVSGCDLLGLLPSGASPLSAVWLLAGIRAIVGNVYYQREGSSLWIGLGKVKTDALPDQPITLTRRRLQTVPIEYRDLSSTALDQPRSLKLVDGIRDGRPLDP